MKRIIFSLLLCLPTSLFAADQSIVCSDANQEIKYPFNRPELKNADYTFIQGSYIEIDQKTEDLQDEIGSDFKKITTIYAQKLSIKSKEKGDTIFDSFVLCESIQKIR